MTTKTFALRLALVVLAIVLIAATAITMVNYGRGDCPPAGGGVVTKWNPAGERSILRLGACG